MDQRTKKMMSMHKSALHPRDDTEILYASRKGGWRFTCIEDCADAFVQRLNDYIKKSKERLITVANNNIESICKDWKTTKTRKRKRESKQLYRYFKPQCSDIKHEKTWTWLQKGNLVREIDSLQIKAQTRQLFLFGSCRCFFSEFWSDRLGFSPEFLRTLV